MSASSTAKWDRRWQRVTAGAVILSAITAVLSLAAGQYQAAFYFTMTTGFISWQYWAMRVLRRHGHYSQET